MCSYVLIGLCILVIVHQSNAKVTDKEYASMPDLFLYDNFDKCLLRKEEAFYCIFTYQLEPLDKDNPPEVWRIIQEASNSTASYRHDKIRHGICIPKTCPNVSKTVDDNDPVLWRGVQDCYDAKFKAQGLKGTIEYMNCQTQYSKYPIDWLDLIVAILFGGYVLFVLYATYYEGVARYQTPEEYHRIMDTPKGRWLLPFSITKNWIRLKTVKSTPELERLRCVQGIKVYNTALVIGCHSILGHIGSPITNLHYMETLHEQFVAMFFGSGPICVGTFLLISTFLLSNGIFDHLKDKKGMDMKLVVFAMANRLFRLTPTLLVVVLYHATWLRYTGFGPQWDSFVGYEYQKCRANGWTNLLYINNWIDTANMCLPVTWSLALDSQYFAIALFLIWFLKSNEKYFSYIIGVLITLVTIGTFCQNYYYDFTALIFPTAEHYYGVKNFLQNFQFHYQVGSFIGNLIPAICGVAWGYYFCNHKNDTPDQYFFRTKFRQLIWWLMTFVIGLLFIIIPGMVIMNVNTEHDRFWSSVYVAVSRPLFGLIIGVAIIGFSEGNGWLGLRVVQWPPVYILGRLSLSVYLIHMSISLKKPSVIRHPIYISDTTMLMAFLGDITVIYIVATLLALFVELPVSQLQKYVFNMGDVKKNNTKEEKQQ